MENICESCIYYEDYGVTSYCCHFIGDEEENPYYYSCCYFESKNAE